MHQKSAVAAASIALAIAAAFCAGAVQAQTPPPPPATASPAPSPSPSPTPRLIQLSGQADVGLSNVSGASSFQFVNGANARVFDTQSGTLDLQNIYLASTLNAGAIGGEFDMSFGTDANVIHSFGMTGMNSYDVTQAYLSYATGPFTLIAGKFGTLAGAELIRSSTDVNFSRSILFGYAVPFTHTGVRLTYAPTSKLSLIAGINNGWDDFKDTNTSKTIEGGIAYNPTSALSVLVQGYTGKEQYVNGPPVVGPQGNRTLIDAVVTYKATSALTLSANVDSGQQANVFLLDGSGAQVLDGSGNPVLGTAKWSGVAGYATYQFTPKWAATVRGETFRDNGGYRTGFDQTWNEGTLTFQYQPSSPLILRAEYRGDSSNQPVFNQNGNGRKTLSSIGLEGIVKF